MTHILNKTCPSTALLSFRAWVGGWVAVHMKTECMIKCTTSQTNKFANSKQIFTSKLLIKGIPQFLTALALLWQQYKHSSEILRLYHYDNDQVPPKVLAHEGLQGELDCHLEHHGTGEGQSMQEQHSCNERWEKGQKDCCPTSHVSSVCY